MWFIFLNVVVKSLVWSVMVNFVGLMEMVVDYLCVYGLMVVLIMFVLVFVKVTLIVVMGKNVCLVMSGILMWMMITILI